MKTIIFILLCIFTCVLACVYGPLLGTEVVDPPEEGKPIDTIVVQIDTIGVDTVEVQQVVFDSCELQNIVIPSFRKCLFEDFGELPDSVIITAGLFGERYVWIKDFQVMTSHVDILQDIVDQHVNFDTMLVLDKTSTANGMLDIHFALFFINPEGSWQSIPDIYFEFMTKRGLLWEKNPRSVYLGDLPTGMDSALIATMQQLPQYAKFGTRGYVTDSLGYDNLLGTLLDSCKCCATIDWRGFPISQDRIDQCEYQNINLIQ